MSIYEYDAEKHLRMEREECTAEGRAQGLKEGIKQGLRQNSELTLKLLEAKRYEDLEQAAKDDTYQRQLLAEFGIL